MKKKIIPLLLFFVASHVIHAVSVGDQGPVAGDTQDRQSDTDQGPVAGDTQDRQSDTDQGPVAGDTQDRQSDTYVPLVQNYPSFTIEFLKMDYLYNLDSKVSSTFHSVKKFNWASLLCVDGVVLYAIRFNQSRFAFCPGVGWSTLSYAFSGTEDKSTDHGKVYPRLKKESEFRTECKNIEHKQGRTVLGTAVKIPFINFLFRFRFNSVLDDPKSGFHTWLGVNLGVRLRASMIVNYKEYSDVGASSVYNSHFNLKAYAVSFQGAVGYARFGIMSGFYLTPLFEQNQGPSNANLLRPFSFSIYVDLI